MESITLKRKHFVYGDIHAITREVLRASEMAHITGAKVQVSAGEWIITVTPDTEAVISTIDDEGMGDG
jgi:hypothetical protein